MLIPARCISCGMPIGDIYDIFHKMKKEKDDKYLKEYNTIVEKASGNLRINIVYDEIFEKLYIKNICCKMHLVTPIDFYKI